MSPGASACAARSHLTNTALRQIPIRRQCEKCRKKDATEGIPPCQHNHRQRPCPSIPINEIGKRASNSFEHVTRFILCPMESSSDPRFCRTNDPTLPFIAVGFHLLH